LPTRGGSWRWRTPGSVSTARAERPGRATTPARKLHAHAGIFIACAGVLTAVNWVTGGGWWSFWPLGVWAVALVVHYMVYKTRSVDESWVEERTADLRSKSYDASHIDVIARDRGTAEDGARGRK
jgi:hypothetical protein